MKGTYSKVRESRLQLFVAVQCELMMVDSE